MINDSISFVHKQESQAIILQRFMTKVYGIMAGGVAITALISYLIYSSGLINFIFENIAFFYIAILSELGLVWYLSSKAYSISSGLAGGLFVVYSILNGITLSFVFLVYSIGSIFEIFLITTIMFGALAAYGYTTKRELSGMGTFLYMGLVGLIVAMIINLFLMSSAFNFAISVIGVIVFAGLTVYDTKRIKETYIEVSKSGESTQGLAINAALSLYLDFINLFLYLLRLLGRK
jgi:FtsH-binding integral membrane protein